MKTQNAKTQVLNILNIINDSNDDNIDNDNYNYNNLLGMTERGLISDNSLDPPRRP